MPSAFSKNTQPLKKSVFTITTTSTSSSPFSSQSFATSISPFSAQSATTSSSPFSSAPIPVTSLTTAVAASSHCATTLSYYTILANSLTIVNELMINFSLGNFNLVEQVLTMDTYNSLSLLLSGLQQNPQQFANYETIRISIMNALQGLLQAVNQHSVLKNTEEMLKIAQNTANILNDMDKLRDYLDNLKKSQSIFPTTTVTLKAATLKPQYEEYIKRYGFPPNGIFDMDLLAECIDYVNFINNGP